MEDLEFIKQTETARREIMAGSWAGTIRAAAAFLKELANGEPLGLQYVEPLYVNREEKPPFVQATELDDNCRIHTLRVTIKVLGGRRTPPVTIKVLGGRRTPPVTIKALGGRARYELQFTRYSLDETQLNNTALG